MQISQLAAQTGVSVHALRHYEKLGLLLPARRPSGYREYTDAMRREVVFIAMSRSIGFSLKAIAAQLPAYRSGKLRFEDMLEAMQGRVDDIDVQIAQLRAQRATVVKHIAWMKNRQKAHLAARALQAAAPTKPAWPAVATRRQRKNP